MEVKEKVLSKCTICTLSKGLQLFKRLHIFIFVHLKLGLYMEEWKKRWVEDNGIARLTGTFKNLKDYADTLNILTLIENENGVEVPPGEWNFLEKGFFCTFISHLLVMCRSIAGTNDDEKYSLFWLLNDIKNNNKFNPKSLKKELQKEQEEWIKEFRKLKALINEYITHFGWKKGDEAELKRIRAHLGEGKRLLEKYVTMVDWNDYQGEIEALLMQLNSNDKRKQITSYFKRRYSEKLPIDWDVIEKSKGVDIGLS